MEKRLLHEFPYPTYEEWRQLTEKSLKGASFEKKLVTKTYEEIDLQPMYSKTDVEELLHTSSLPGFAPFVRGVDATGNLLQPCEVSQEIAYSSPAACNQALKHDLEKGQTTLHLVLDQATLAGDDADHTSSHTVGRNGVSISSYSDLTVALEGLDLEKLPIFVHAGSSSLPMISMLAAYIRKKKQEVRSLHGCVGMDPLAELVSEGSLSSQIESVYTLMAQMTAWAKDAAPHLQTILVQSHPYHNSGSSAVQELAFALATGVEYLRELQKRGVLVEDSAPRIRFSFSVGTQFFMEIAKLRAARLLWADIVEAFGGSVAAGKMKMHVRTSAWSKTVHDPYVNMLRSTAEAFAGVVAGADSLHVSAFDEPIRPADEFSRRIARNTQIILQQEAHLSKTVDPGGGSWYIETLTDSLAKKVWALFQQVEAKGGMLQALREGIPQAEIAKIAVKRAENIAHRKDKFVGTNMYPNLNEKPLTEHAFDQQAFSSQRSAELAAYRQTVDHAARKNALHSLSDATKTASGNVVELAIEAVLSGASVGDITKATLREGAASISVTPVHIHRGADMFEGLRKASDEYKENTGTRPQVFLANMGPIPQHKARADFSKGFFEVGGFEVLTNNGFSTVEEAAESAIQSPASIVVICSTDDTYDELVPSFARLLKAASPETMLFVAGSPASCEQAAKFSEEGVHDYIHLRSNCYEILHTLQREKGILS